MKKLKLITMISGILFLSACCTTGNTTAKDTIGRIDCKEKLPLAHCVFVWEEDKKGCIEKYWTPADKENCYKNIIHK